MGISNRKTDKLINKDKIGILIFLCVVCMLIYFSSLALTEFDDIRLSQGKYSGELGNWLGHSTYYFDSYEKKGNAYKLYDKNGQLSGEINISDGYVFTIKINK